MPSFFSRLMSGTSLRREDDAMGAKQWIAELEYPELWEAVDEALVKTACEFPVACPLAERWVALPKRVRAKLHGHLRAAMLRRMASL
jgi:hypothetical protein